MHEEAMSGLQYFVIIAEQKKKNKYISILADFDARGVETVYGHGSMSPSAIAAAFGFETAQGRVMISCLLKTEQARKLIDLLCKKYHFDQPNTGIAFGIPVEGLAF